MVSLTNHWQPQHATYRYDAILRMMLSGKLHPEKLLGRTISLKHIIQRK